MQDPRQRLRWGLEVVISRLEVLDEIFELQIELEIEGIRSPEFRLQHDASFQASFRAIETWDAMHEQGRTSHCCTATWRRRCGPSQSAVLRTMRTSRSQIWATRWLVLPRIADRTGP